MKKVRIISAILAALMLATLALTFTASAEEHSWKVDLGEKVNVLAGNSGLLQTPQTIKNVDVATDGTHFGWGKDPRVFINEKVYDSENAGAVSEENPGTYEYKMANGTTKTYYYEITWHDVYADVNSFDMYISGENHYLGDEKEGKLGVRLPNYHFDAEFDILVSTDAGATWEVAWESNRFVTDPNSSAIVIGCAGFTEDEMIPGTGDPAKAAVEVKYADPSDPATPVTTYRYMKGEFVKEFKNVTNIAYCVSKIRRNGSQEIESWTDDTKAVALTSKCIPTATPFWYVTRISEFEVFGKLNEKPATTPAPETTKKPETTKAPETTKKPETTAAPAATEAPATEAPKTEEKKGCGSVASIGVAVVVTVLGSAIIRKKH